MIIWFKLPKARPEQETNPNNGFDSITITKMELSVTETVTVDALQEIATDTNGKLDQLMVLDRLSARLSIQTSQESSVASNDNLQVSRSNTIHSI